MSWNWQETERCSGCGDIVHPEYLNSEGRCPDCRPTPKIYQWTKVVNKKQESYEVYIGRGSMFGNPFQIGRDGDRAEVIRKFEEWFRFCLRDKTFLEEVLKLKGKRLGCFCKQPDREVACHGDVIAEYLNSL
jgi:hypothetical protein